MQDTPLDDGTYRPGRETDMSTTLKVYVNDDDALLYWGRRK